LTTSRRTTSVIAEKRPLQPIFALLELRNSLLNVSIRLTTRQAGRGQLSVPLPYSMILATTPAPTVRPPSRIAKRSPSSIAIGAISSTTICTLSPGITISVPSGSSTAPVTSVVRK